MAHLTEHPFIWLISHTVDINRIPAINDNENKYIAYIWIYSINVFFFFYMRTKWISNGTKPNWVGGKWTWNIYCIRVIAVIKFE